jgi:Zn-dependent membrane protease YugP
MFFDPMYLLFAGPAMIIMLYAQYRVSSTYKKYSKVSNTQRRTGADIALLLLRANGLSNVRVEETKGVLTDHYDPRNKTLRLSKDVYRFSSVSAMVPVANVGTWLGYGCFLAGIVLSVTNLVWAGVILFSGVVAFAMVTLPVEFNASVRARQMLSSNGLVNTAENDGVRAVLSAAALTYVAALLQAASNLMYYIFVATGMSRRE